MRIKIDFSGYIRANSLKFIIREASTRVCCSHMGSPSCEGSWLLSWNLFTDLLQKCVQRPGMWTVMNGSVRSTCQLWELGGTPWNLLHTYKFLNSLVFMPSSLVNYRAPYIFYRSHSYTFQVPFARTTSYIFNSFFCKHLTTAAEWTTDWGCLIYIFYLL